MTYFYTRFKNFFTAACILFTFAEANAMCSPTEVEEGWRPGTSLRVAITDGGKRDLLCDVKDVHEQMAYTLADMAGTHKKLGNKESRMLAIFRFTPIIEMGDEFLPGTAIALTDHITQCSTGKTPRPPSVAGEEYVFGSGGFDASKDAKKHFKEIMPYSISYGGRKKAKMFRILPSLSTASHATFMMRGYVDPGILSDHIDWRFSPDNLKGSLLRRGDFMRLANLHAPTRHALTKRADRLVKFFQDLALIAPDTDADTLNEMRNTELERGKKDFYKNANTNSYDCAEQLGFDFLEGEKTQAWLREQAQKQVDMYAGELAGVLIHIHTSETPCAHCATTIAREAEEGGVFSRIFGQHTPVRPIVTSPIQYERSVGRKVHYQHTRAFKEKPMGDIPFDLTTMEQGPYPTILYGYDGKGYNLSHTDSWGA